MERQTPPLMRLCMATRTFSSAVMLWKRRMFWKVRAMPSAVTLCGGSPLIGAPSKITPPAVGL